MNVSGGGCAVLQVSDPHFGTERQPVAQALQQLAAKLAPQLVVLSGDITQRATATQFEAARLFMRGLHVPVLAVPGNHDIPLLNLGLRLLAPYARHRRAFGAQLEPVFESPQLLVLGVNTTRAWRHKDGQISSAQVERVAARLQAAAPGQLRVVVVHQPVAVTQQRDQHNLVHGAVPAVRRWAEAGADLIAGGHIHLPYVLALHEILPGLARRVWAVQAGTAVSTRVRHEAPNSVNALRLDAAAPGHCMVERWDYLEAARCFVAVSRHDLRLDRPQGAAGAWPGVDPAAGRLSTARWFS